MLLNQEKLLWFQGKRPAPTISEPFRNLRKIIRTVNIRANAESKQAVQARNERDVFVSRKVCSLIQYNIRALRRHEFSCDRCQAD